MNLEHPSHPPLAAAQQRYDELHLAIERGMDADESWQELASICLQLGEHAEAESCARRVRTVTLRLSLLSKITRERARAAVARPPESHRKAPAASDAGPTRADAEPHQPTLREHVVDALQFLLHQHMPWLALMTLLAFPLVVGLGGHLIADRSPMLLLAIATVPCLCVLMLVAAMARRVLLASAEGHGEVPQVPAFGELACDAGAFVGDALLVGGLLLGPGFTAALLAAPALSTLLGLAVGTFLMPLAWALRQLRGDLAALSPVTLMRGARRCGADYVGLAATVVAAFAPVLATALVLKGHAEWLQVAALTPLGLLATLFASRLLGTWLDAHRQRLGGLVLPGALNEAPQEVAAEPAAAAEAAPVSRPAPRSIEGRQPQRKPTDQPDLRNMASATVLSGAARSHAGAAAKHV